MAVLITGGAGFIGTHTCVELLNAGEEIVVFDNFANSKMSAVENVKKITGKDFPFYEADMLDRDAMEKIFSELVLGDTLPKPTLVRLLKVK